MPHNIVSSCIKRGSLVFQYVRIASEEVRTCETLILDQHLQHQGWQAVVANLEDTAVALKRKKDVFCAAFEQYLAQRDHFR